MDTSSQGATYRTEKNFSTRVGCDKAVMMWDVNYLYGSSSLVFLEGMQNLGKYCERLESGLWTFFTYLFGQSLPWQF